jgi:hypothetical protein
MSWLQGKRVGYVPYSAGLSGPGDRRGFVRYATLRGVPFEVVREGRDYDVIVLCSLADITHYSRLPRPGPRLVYALTDPYLAERSLSLRALLRGPGKFLLGHFRHFEVSYRTALKRMLARADAIICSAQEQTEEISRWNRNVHPILDFQASDIKSIKTTYDMGQRVNLVWEGFPENVVTFGHIVPVLRRLSARRPIALHLITAPTYAAINGPVPRIPTRALIRRTLPGIRTLLYEWDSATASSIAAACDIALIPMIEGSMYWAKPENKLLVFWRMGLPVVTSATPAYERAMRAAGIDLACRDPAEWENRLESLIASEDDRRQAADRGRSFAEREHSEEACARRWDAVFESLAVAAPGAAARVG